MERLWLLWHTNPSLNPRQPPFCSGRYFLSLGFLISNGVWGWEWVIQPPPTSQGFWEISVRSCYSSCHTPPGTRRGFGNRWHVHMNRGRGTEAAWDTGMCGTESSPWSPEQKRPATGAWFPWLFSRSFRAALCLSTSCPSCAKLLEWIGEVKIQGDVCVARWVSYFDWSRNVCLEIFFSYLLRSN